MPRTFRITLKKDGNVLIDTAWQEDQVLPTEFFIPRHYREEMSKPLFSHMELMIGGTVVRIEKVA